MKNYFLPFLFAALLGTTFLTSCTPEDEEGEPMELSDKGGEAEEDL